MAKIQSNDRFGFNAKAATSNSASIKINISYSVNGTEWTTIESNKSLTSSSKSYSVDIPDGGKYFQIAISSSSTKPTSGNAQLTVDDVVFTYSTTPATQVATPSFSVAAGTYNAAQSVELSCGTNGATIYYTTDESTPTTSSSVYSSAIAVNQSMTIKAIGVKDGLTNSAEASAAYTLKCATPEVAVPSGAFVSSKEVTITSSDGATIRYTTDGSTTPTTSTGTVYDPSSKPSISATTTIKAIAYKDGWTDSDVTTKTFTKENVLNGISALNSATTTTETAYYVYLTDAQVTWRGTASSKSIAYLNDESAGIYVYNVSMTLNMKYNGVWRITTKKYSNLPEITAFAEVSGEGTSEVAAAMAPTVMTPSALDDAFTANLGRQIQINNFEVPEGKALTSNINLYGDSPYTDVTVGKTYTLVGYPFINSTTKTFRVVSAIEKPAAPTFDIAEGEFYEAFTLHLGCVTDGVTMYYTTDGNVPTTSSTEYDDATGIAITASTTTVKAIAVKSNMESDVASATYTYKAVSKPTFSPATETSLYYGETVEITCSTDGSDIYYTTNGEEPTTSSTKYTDPVAINGDVTLKAIAVKGSDESSVASASYTLKTPDAPEFNVAEGAVESGTVLTITSRAGTTIYYTTDGSDPNNSTDSGSNSVEVTIDADMTVRAIAVDGALNISPETSADYVLYTDPTFSVEDMSLAIGEQGIPEVTTNSAGIVSFESKNSAIATIVDGKVNAVAKGTATITATIAVSGIYREKSVDFTVTVVTAPVWESTSKGIDVLTAGDFGITTTNSYTNFSSKTFNSSAQYAGNAAKKSNGAIQLNSSSPKGIVTTTSGGKVRKVTVSWDTENERVLEVYGKNTAYSSGSDLYSNNTDTKGELIGSFNSKSDVVTLNITGDYQFIGFRSNSSALYLNNITIYWEGDAVTLADDEDYAPVSKDYAKVTLDREFQAGWNGVVLPFDFTTDVKTALGASEVKTLGNATEESGAVTLNFTNASLPVAAGTPVLVKCGADLASGEVVINGAEIKTTDPTTTVDTKTVAGNTFALTGTYSETDLEDAEAYFVAGDKFYHKAAGVALTAKPFRAYITQTASDGARMAVNFNLEGDEVAGISTVNSEMPNNNRYYDMLGRRVAQPTKGLYIVNGKKVLVK